MTVYYICCVCDVCKLKQCFLHNTTYSVQSYNWHGHDVHEASRLWCSLPLYVRIYNVIVVELILY